MPANKAEFSENRKRTFARAIKKQKALIRECGQEPTWEIFSETFGWYQMRQMMSPEAQALYERIWKGNA